MGVQDILNEIKEITTEENCKCLYRGEPKNYPEVSSKLYRDLKENELDFLNVFITQKDELMYARDQMQEPHFGPPGVEFGPFFHAFDRYEVELITEIQHLGGSTVFIDFTLNSDVALFFACCKKPSKDGRVIILPLKENDDFPHSDIREILLFPRQPKHRITAQQSVFVVPQDGYLKKKRYQSVTVSKELKKECLEYLEKEKGISYRYLYNDAIGYVEYQRLRFKSKQIGHHGMTAEQRKWRNLNV